MSFPVVSAVWCGLGLVMVQLHGTANDLAEHMEASAGRAQARFGCGRASHRHSFSVMMTVAAHLLPRSFLPFLHPARNVPAAKVVPEVHSGGFYYPDFFFFFFHFWALLFASENNLMTVGPWIQPGCCLDQL